MKIRELIEELMKLDLDGDVTIADQYGGPGLPIGKIERGRELRWTEGSAALIDLAILHTTEDSET